MSLHSAASLLLGSKAVQNAALITENLPPEIAASIQKIKKRAETTRVKGLSELTTSLSSMDPSLLLEICQCLTNLLPLITYDANPRVRLSLARFFEQLSLSPKRELLRCLEFVIPFWLGLRFDPGREISKKALFSWTSLFKSGDNKVVSQFKTQIISQISHSFSLSIQSLLKEGYSNDDAQVILQLSMNSGICCLNYLLDNLIEIDPELINCLVSINSKKILVNFLTEVQPSFLRISILTLISNPKFWTLVEFNPSAHQFQSNVIKKLIDGLTGSLGLNYLATFLSLKDINSTIFKNSVSNIGNLMQKETFDLELSELVPPLIIKIQNIIKNSLFTITISRCFSSLLRVKNGDPYYDKAVESVVEVLKILYNFELIKTDGFLEFFHDVLECVFQSTVKLTPIFDWMLSTSLDSMMIDYLIEHECATSRVFDFYLTFFPIKIDSRPDLYLKYLPSLIENFKSNNFTENQSIIELFLKEVKSIPAEMIDVIVKSALDCQSISTISLIILISSVEISINLIDSGKIDTELFLSSINQIIQSKMTDVTVLIPLIENFSSNFEKLVTSEEIFLEYLKFPLEFINQSNLIDCPFLSSSRVSLSILQLISTSPNQNLIDLDIISNCLLLISSNNDQIDCSNIQIKISSPSNLIESLVGTCTNKSYSFNQSNFELMSSILNQSIIFDCQSIDDVSSLVNSSLYFTLFLIVISIPKVSISTEIESFLVKLYGDLIINSFIFSKNITFINNPSDFLINTLTSSLFHRLIENFDQNLINFELIKNNCFCHFLVKYMSSFSSFKSIFDILIGYQTVSISEVVGLIGVFDPNFDIDDVFSTQLTAFDCLPSSILLLFTQKVFDFPLNFDPHDAKPLSLFKLITRRAHLNVDDCLKVQDPIIFASIVHLIPNFDEKFCNKFLNIFESINSFDLMTFTLFSKILTHFKDQYLLPKFLSLLCSIISRHNFDLKFWTNHYDIDSRLFLTVQSNDYDLSSFDHVTILCNFLPKTAIYLSNSPISLNNLIENFRSFYSQIEEVNFFISKDGTPPLHLPRDLVSLFIQSRFVLYRLARLSNVDLQSFDDVIDDIIDLSVSFLLFSDCKQSNLIDAGDLIMDFENLPANVFLLAGIYFSKILRTKLSKNSKLFKFCSNFSSSKLINHFLIAEFKHLSLINSLRFDETPNCYLSITPLTKNSVEISINREEETFSAGKITISYPNNFPLKAPLCSLSTSYNVDRPELRRLLVAITASMTSPTRVDQLAQISSQVQSLIDCRKVGLSDSSHLFGACLAISKFLKNIDAAEVCSVCYSVLLHSNGSIPDKECINCKNKFHKSCLEKWFAMSDSSRCPLCSYTLLL
ncbi:hypothetical protein RCL1_000168 [Eukaryota sp. TZLM3-RCL]